MGTTGNGQKTHDSSLNWQSRQSTTPYYQAEFGAEFDMTLDNRFPEDKYFVKNAVQYRRSYFKKRNENDYSPRSWSKKNSPLHKTDTNFVQERLRESIPST